MNRFYDLGHYMGVVASFKARYKAKLIVRRYEKSKETGKPILTTADAVALSLETFDETKESVITHCWQGASAFFELLALGFWTKSGPINYRHIFLGQID